MYKNFGADTLKTQTSKSLSDLRQSDQIDISNCSDSEYILIKFVNRYQLVIFSNTGSVTRRQRDILVYRSTKLMLGLDLDYFM